MNILYIDHYAGSIKYGRSFRPYYLGQEWKKDGHRLVVVGGTYSHIRNIQPKHPGVEMIDGITYIWLKTPKYKGNGIGRVWSMIVFMLKLFFSLRKILNIAEPNVIIGSTVYMLDMYPAWLMKKLSSKRTKLIFELHDIWPLTLIELGNISRFHPFIILLKITELWTYKVVDVVVSILPKTFSYVKKFGIKEPQFFYIPNGIVVEDWKKSEPLPKEHQTIIHALKESGKFLVGYAGSHSIANALTDVIDVAIELQNQKLLDIHFILVGGGQEKENLIKYAYSKGINNITFVDRISKLAIPEFLKQMDVLYIGLQKKMLFQYGVSANKIFDYMMAGRPILQTIFTGGDIIKEAKCGVSVESGEIKDIVKALLELKNMPKHTLRELGKNGQTCVIKEYDYKILAKDFLNAIKI